MAIPLACRSGVVLIGAISLMTVALAQEVAPAANALGRESSPYLLAHAHNPVHWQPWGPAALARAKAERKLIFLSIGYHACHWCHVMERESFQNAKLAELLNAHFVCIKVDREERPDVDQVYLAALQAMGQSGGWPLSMFLTADGRPIAGGTYWPPEDREVDGQTVPGFSTILQSVIDFHAMAPEDIDRTATLRAEQTRRALAIDLSLTKPEPLGLATVSAAIDRFRERFDPVHGGFGRPPQFVGPKFPRPPVLMLLLDEGRRAPTDDLRSMIHLTLTELANGGTYDQIGGGFHRYSTERTWTVPHFEKMLYDNAQLLEVYAAAMRDRPEPRYRDVLRETAAFLLREMTTADGVFVSSLDADSDGAEGRFYTWTDAELAAALPEAADREFVRRLLSMDGPANFEERFIPVRRTPLDPTDVDRWQRLRSQLLAARGPRPRPATDTKVLLSWNGLAIAGLAAAGEALSDPELIARAERAADFLLRTMRVDGRWQHVYAASPGESPRPQIPAYLDDETHFVHGLLTLYEITKQPRWLTAAREMTDDLLARFHDAQSGGFFYTAADHDALFVRLKDQHDGVVPSGNSQAVLNLLRLHRLTGEDRYRTIAEQSLATFAAGLDATPDGLPGLCRAILLRSPAAKE
jgi:uncharacterized protein YyaL (SSP411 family)